MSFFLESQKRTSTLLGRVMETGSNVGGLRLCGIGAPAWVCRTSWESMELVHIKLVLFSVFLVWISLGEYRYL